MRISDCSSDVCSSDLNTVFRLDPAMGCKGVELDPEDQCGCETEAKGEHPKGNGTRETLICFAHPQRRVLKRGMKVRKRLSRGVVRTSRRSMRSEEHTSELQSLMRISYAGFCLKKKTTQDLKRTI